MSSNVDPKPAEDVGEENEEIKLSEGALERSEMFLDAAIDRSINTRAKLYVHTIDSNEWTDRGTGNAVTLSEKNDDSKLFVHFSNEKDRKICYDWPVEEDMDFSRSQGTIIMFAPTDEYQASLSFQTEEGADIFWKGLCRHLGRDPTNLDQFSPNSSDDEGFLDTPAAVPPIKLGTLSEIARIVTQAQGVNAMKDRIATILVKNNWLIALKNLYDITADLEDGYSLALISSIVRSLLMLNRDDIIEHLFDKGNLRIVFELLSHVHGENHPMDHVKFLYETAGMKHVIRITDEDKERIQKAYRIQYLMDFILPPRLSSMVLMEDSWIVSIESYMAVLRSNILNGIMKGASFKSEVITSLESPILADSHRRNLTLFLKEFFKMADNQAITPIEKRRILMNLMELGILRMIKPSLRSNDYTIKKITVEIMLSLAAHDTKDLLKFIVEDAKSITEPSILSELAQIFVHDSDPETQLAEAVFQLIRTLIDNEDHGVENSMDQKHFVSLFFRNHFRQVLQPLIDNVEGGTLKKDTYHTSRKANITISLASFFVEHHASVAVRHLTSVDISKSIVATIGSKHPSLVLASLKFMKTVVVLNDEKYTQHLVADGILILMVSIFCQKYKNSNNLYNSTFLSFFDAVKKRDDIVQHIMENYHTDFEDLTYCQVFTDFKQTYRHYLHLRDLSGKPINYGPTRSREDRVKEYDFPDDEAESTAPLPESKFRPRPLLKQEDEGALTTRTVTARPPTPMRIVLKASRLAPAGPTAEDGDKENKESAEPIKIEQIRLVDYDDSDNDSSSDREDENEANPVPTGDDQPEQRGKKRKAFEEGETPGTANQPKRSFEL